jgi:hypothetical protein
MDLHRRPGLVSASIIVMVVIGAFSGGLVGLILGTMLNSQLSLAIVAAFAAVIVAFIARPHRIWLSRTILLPAAAHSLAHHYFRVGRWVGGTRVGRRSKRAPRIGFDWRYLRPPCRGFVLLFRHNVPLSEGRSRLTNKFVLHRPLY